MPCTPDYCDVHDYPVAPGGGWCRAVDAAYLRAQTMPRSGSHDEILAGAILRLGEIFERMEGRQPNWSPPQPAQTEPQRGQQQRRGGTPF